MTIKGTLFSKTWSNYYWNHAFPTMLAGKELMTHNYGSPTTFVAFASMEHDAPQIQSHGIIISLLLTDLA